MAHGSGSKRWVFLCKCLSFSCTRDTSRDLQQLEKQLTRELETFFATSNLAPNSTAGELHHRPGTCDDDEHTRWTMRSFFRCANVGGKRLNIRMKGRHRLEHSRFPTCFFPLHKNFYFHTSFLFQIILHLKKKNHLETETRWEADVLVATSRAPFVLPRTAA